MCRHRHHLLSLMYCEACESNIFCLISHFLNRFDISKIITKGGQMTNYFVK